MDKRTTILAAVFGVAAFSGLALKTIYPRYIKPLFTYDDRIAEGQEELDKLNEIQWRVERGRYAYKDIVRRIGSYDIASVENALRQELNTLIEKHDLKEASVSPSRTSEDRKTGVKSMVLTIQADGSLHGIAGLMRDVAKLPQMLRFGDVSITPGKSTLSGGRPTLYEQVSLRMPIEISVLPRHRLVGAIDLDKLPPPEPKVRHRHNDYSSLWSGRPFSEYYEPQPLTVDAGGDQSVQRPGRTALLRGKVSGGIGEYSMRWSPSDRLDKPGALTARMDTSEPGAYEYALTVTDESGATAEDTVTVTVNEPPEPREHTTVDRTPRREPEPKDRRWRDRRYRHVVMVLGRSVGDERTDEAMVYDRRAKAHSYYKAGDEFDGGTLVYVHQTGLLVRRDDAYFVYPLGELLDKDIKLEEAERYPEIQRAAERHQAWLLEQGETEPSGEGKNDAEASDRTAADQETKTQDGKAVESVAAEAVEGVAAPPQRGETLPPAAKPVDRRSRYRAPGAVGRRPNRTRRLPGERPRRPKAIKPGGRKPN